MSNWHFNPRVLRDPTWWQWAITVALLSAHLIFRAPYALEFAVALCLAMGITYFALVRDVRPYPVQIRLGYLLLLVLGLLGWAQSARPLGETDPSPRSIAVPRISSGGDP